MKVKYLKLIDVRGMEFISGYLKQNKHYICFDEGDHYTTYKVIMDDGNLHLGIWKYRFIP